jgi:hypothetical protein
MGIDEKHFRIIWRAITKWKDRLGLSLTDLKNITGLSIYDVKRGLEHGDVWITSECVHNCVEFFGIPAARKLSPEDTIDILTDEECVEAILRILETDR